MMIDFALEARAQGGQDAGGGDLPGVPAALPADHDDDDGGAAGRVAAGAGHGIGSELRRPLGITIVGGLDVQPGADAVHDAGDLPVRSIGWRTRIAKWREKDGVPENRSGAEGVMNISEPFIRRPVATTLLTIALALAGSDGVSAAAGVAAAASRVPDDLRSGASAGRESGDDGVVGGDAAGAAVRADCGCERDDLDQFARRSTSIVLQFDLNRNIDAAARDVQAAINAAAGNCRRICRTIRAIERSIRPTRRS